MVTKARLDPRLALGMCGLRPPPPEAAQSPRLHFIVRFRVGLQVQSWWKRMARANQTGVPNYSSAMAVSWY